SLHSITGMGWESQWSFSDRYMRATVLSHEIERSFSVLIFSGVLDRFPDLQIVSAENNCGWLPYYLQRMDRTFERGRYAAVVKLGSAAAAFGIGFPTVLRAQPKEVVMLGLWSFTGAFSDVGPVLDRGMKLALEERGMKVQSKTIKYITRDDETKAGSATRRAEEAVDSDGAKFIIG